MRKVRNVCYLKHAILMARSMLAKRLRRSFDNEFGLTAISVYHLMESGAVDIGAAYSLLESAGWPWHPLNEMKVRRRYPKRHGHA